MNDFTMTARTVDGEWKTFSILDVPCLIDDEHFVLLRKCGSPILESSLLRRGFGEFVEGDIWEDETGCRWLICYERGFYGIDKDYRIAYLTDTERWNRVGYCEDIEFPVKGYYRTKHLFKTDGVVYRLCSIYGMHEDKVLVRGISRFVKPEEIRQECCVAYNDKRLFLGDTVEDKVVQLQYGRVVIPMEGRYKDISTGGVL